MSKCKDECADHVQELLKQIEQLHAENERLRDTLMGNTLSCKKAQQFLKDNKP